MAAEHKPEATEPPAIQAIREAIRQLVDHVEAYNWATAKKRKLSVAVKMLRLTTDFQQQVTDLIESA